MGKVSIGLRGWRFDESDLFTDEGEWRPVESIPEEPRHRLLRLQVVMNKPCDACYLIHGEENKRRCREATIVYGEPLEEVLLCDEHEADFLYWFRERGGSSVAGEETFRDAFHEWFDDGGRAPDGYGGMDHVEEAPDDLPDLPDPGELYEDDDEMLADERPDFEEGEGSGVSDTAGDADDDGDDEGDDGLSVDDLDLDREYPT
ncbi:hypothetical protein Hbl1158_09515 [Halobaculum sp. CBA1158]|uniref:hypothetical protein n=1 Tax=Halobaculum sp. CBA1158 TaxID=2904243 RepID=UPI001F4199C4|nr:hypothetical protein [Halobaculum sp. CBA1158]UIO98778.1 hypothetical protein Hbl1158_09515 [Halobaculum sp. CBA1158]